MQAYVDQVVGDHALILLFSGDKDKDCRELWVDVRKIKRGRRVIREGTYITITPSILRGRTLGGETYKTGQDAVVVDHLANQEMNRRTNAVLGRLRKKQKGGV